MSRVTPEAALQRLREAAASGALARVCRAHELRLLVAFGSTLTQPGRAEDLDLAYLPDRPVDTLRLLDDLYRLSGSEHIDLMDLSRAGPVARMHALGRGVPLFEAQPHLFAEEQITAIARYCDTRWLRDLELDALAGP